MYNNSAKKQKRGEELFMLSPSSNDFIILKFIMFEVLDFSKEL